MELHAWMRISNFYIKYFLSTLITVIQSLFLLNIISFGLFCPVFAITSLVRNQWSLNKLIDIITEYRLPFFLWNIRKFLNALFTWQNDLHHVLMQNFPCSLADTHSWLVYLATKNISNTSFRAWNFCDYFKNYIIASPNNLPSHF